MAQRTVTVGSSVGLHARPASLFVQAAARQPVKVKIAKPGGDPVDARSILLVLGLDARGGEEVILTAEGEGAEQALEELATVVATVHHARRHSDRALATWSRRSGGEAVGPVARLDAAPSLRRPQRRSRSPRRRGR